jgi:hypothetical protein
VSVSLHSHFFLVSTPLSSHLFHPHLPLFTHRRHFTSCALEFESARATTLQAVLQNPFALEFASTQFQNDRDIVLGAVRRDGRVLRFASDLLKNDMEIVIAAVQQNGRSLEFASPALRQNSRVLHSAIASDPSAQQFAICEALIKYYPNQYSPQRVDMASNPLSNAASVESWMIGRGSSTHRLGAVLDHQETLSDGCVFMG